MGQSVPEANGKGPEEKGRYRGSGDPTPSTDDVVGTPGFQFSLSGTVDNDSGEIVEVDVR